MLKYTKKPKKCIMRVVVKTTGVEFVKSKTLTSLTFLGVVLLFLFSSRVSNSNNLYAASETKTYCTEIPINAYIVNSPNVWSCNYGYKEEGNLCVKVLPGTSSNVKGQSTTGVNIPSSICVLLFLIGNSLVILYLVNKKEQQSFW